MLTSQRNYSLRIDMEHFEGESRHADYSIFTVDSGVNKYRLTIGGYSGDAGKCTAHIKGDLSPLIWYE